MASSNSKLERTRSRFPSFKKIGRPLNSDAAPSQRSSDKDVQPGTHLLSSPQQPSAAHGPPKDPFVASTSAPSVPPLAPPVLKVNRHGIAPVVCKAHDAKVAARGNFDRLVITSPNMDYVPEYPVESSIISTYSDGRWGKHEYSRWPQDIVRGMWHVACIPNAPSSDVPDVLWETLLPETHWVEDPSIGFNGIGYIVPETKDALAAAARAAIRRFDGMQAPDNVMKYGRLLVLILRQVLERMESFPVAAGVAIAVAAHVQRVCLELAGLKTYAEVVVPRLESGRDYSADILPVIGTFVRDGSDALNCPRVGLPTWILRPLTHELPVWKVVECVPPSFAPSKTSDPSIKQDPRFLAGVPNPTGNWLSTMLLRVSEQVAGTHLSQLSLAEVLNLSDDEAEPSSKRPRVDGGGRLVMPVPRPSASESSKKSKRRKKGRGGANVQRQPVDAVGTSSGTPSSPAHPEPSTFHPSKSFTPSPFYDVSPVWTTALRAVSPVPRTLNSAVYFYPPPFLLDTISSVAALPQCAHPEHARSDKKIHRYLHNLVRIREFCRVRMFDVTIANQPLTTAEWRAALWGDYQVKPPPRAIPGAPSDARRSARRQEERRGISRLFGRVGLMRSYRADETIDFLGSAIDLPRIATDVQLRSRLLWESHEVNFRAELLTLDALMVQKPSWSFNNRLERESLVSTVWGPPASIMSVFPPGNDDVRVFRWHSPPGDGWMACRETLRNFATVLRRWPDCPDDVAEGVSHETTELEVARIQNLAVDFYVRTFVNHYARLPVPPIPFPF
ncbi:hypothetical protein LXA43DRAFT_1104101 [Ganoderma leucocontextum]|nr:hypothetical protein LXA43DRAFT_1104101 [Ganoderma leucocontextum]